MKLLKLYKSAYGSSTENEVFNFLISNMTDSIKYWDYFVNWNKVRTNVGGLEIDLNTLNYLVGKDDIETEFKYLLSKYPSVIRLIPILLACREKKFKILTSYSDAKLQYEVFDFDPNRSLTANEIEQLCRFSNETGLLSIFQKKIVKSIPDYVTGIEVGLDSNGRKNRSGSSMENIVESFVKLTCEKHNFEYIPQADSEKVRKVWNMKLNVDKSDRRFDFAVRRNDKLFLIETNYYGGGGSKLKATAGEYKSLFEFTTLHGYGFIWITDGLGWNSTLKPLSEAYAKLDFILNLRMVTDGALDEAILYE